MIGLDSRPIWSVVERKCMYMLQRVFNKKDISKVHAFMLRNGAETNPNLIAKLIADYACLSLTDHARNVFDHCRDRDDTFLCNSMIKALLVSPQVAECVTLYRDLRRRTHFSPNEFTFSVLAKSCGLAASVGQCLAMHCQVWKFGFIVDVCVATSLVEMYTKCGAMSIAAQLFDEMPDKSVVSWTVMISGYSRLGDMMHAKLLFDEVPAKDAASRNAMIDCYVKSGDMEMAHKLFDEMPDKNVISWTTLINGYCNKGNIDCARNLFDSMPCRNLFSWNAMINGYSRSNSPAEALKLFEEMLSRESLELDEVTIVSILPAIAELGALATGKWVHQLARRKKMDSKVNVGTALIDMYAKCGEFEIARGVFDSMKLKETVSWNSLMNSYALNGCAHEALEAFRRMQLEGIKPNGVTMLIVLSACNHGGLLDEGKQWFEDMNTLGIARKIEHYGCMIDLLGRAGCLEEAEKLMESMPYPPNGVIVSSLVFSCCYHNDLERAKRVQQRAVAFPEPWNDGNYIACRNMFAKEKSWENVQEVKKSMRERGVRKQCGFSAIEVEGQIWEFNAGKTSHPKRIEIEFVLEMFCKYANLDK